MKRSILWALVFSLSSVCLAQGQTPDKSTATAAPIRVDCDKGRSISATLAGLVRSGHTRNVTISVTGTCKENIVIAAFDHLVLQGGSDIATIQDASKGTAPVVSIVSSFDVTLQGFTINGGAEGVNCGLSSVCTLTLNTIQQSIGPAGVRIGRSTAYLTSNNILNHAKHGILVLNGGNVSTDSNTISNNGGVGILVNDHSYAQAAGDTIQSNAIGIRVTTNSDVRPIGVTIIDNRSEGVRLESGSTASFGNTGNVVTS